MAAERLRLYVISTLYWNNLVYIVNLSFGFLMRYMQMFQCIWNFCGSSGTMYMQRDFYIFILVAVKENIASSYCIP